jgi:hypothetical protein
MQTKSDNNVNFLRKKLIINIEYSAYYQAVEEVWTLALYEAKPHAAQLPWNNQHKRSIDQNIKMTWC